MAHVAAAIAVQLANTAVKAWVVCASSDRCLAVGAREASWAVACVAGAAVGDTLTTV